MQKIYELSTLHDSGLVPREFWHSHFSRKPDVFFAAVNL